jgi:2-polyprenyl-3-methyl-5-hydroxy-6-metoxy-1,4-benzoquinol methylase
MRASDKRPHRALVADDPVVAYDAVAASFSALATARQAYLDAIDRLVAGNMPEGAGSLLDVGAGDARRARRIAAAAGISRLVLLEPSAGMRQTAQSPSDYIDLRAEELESLEGSFDAITCLWNVLGHVFPQAAREEMLRQCALRLSPKGRLFVDVSHRYNARLYGTIRTAGRFLYDLLRPADTNGDVVATWQTGSLRTTFRGHVFTNREFRGLARRAGLSIDACYVVDYATGAICAHTVQGHLLYVMSRAAPAVS